MRRAKVVIADEESRRAVADTDMAVEQVSRTPHLKEVLANRKPAVAVVALDLPGLGGASGLRELRKISPATRIIAVTPDANESEELQVLRTGAKGYVADNISDPTLSKAIRKVHEGEVWAGRHAIGVLLDELIDGPQEGTSSVMDDATRASLAEKLRPLTRRELETVRLLADGATNKEIAMALNVSVSTVKAHLTSIFRKLGQPDRLRLALFLSEAVHARASGIIEEH